MAKYNVWVGEYNVTKYSSVLSLTLMPKRKTIGWPGNRLMRGRWPWVGQLNCLVPFGPAPSSNCRSATGESLDLEGFKYSSCVYNWILHLRLFCWRFSSSRGRKRKQEIKFGNFKQCIFYFKHPEKWRGWDDYSLSFVRSVVMSTLLLHVPSEVVLLFYLFFFHIHWACSQISLHFKRGLKKIPNT